jgi:vesicle-associated membrane protein 7
MPILYSLVGRRTTVLAEHSAAQGNAPAVARAILEKLSSTEQRASYSQDRHLFHVLVCNGLTFLCMADEVFGRKVPFTYLDEVAKRFAAAYGPAADTALAYAYNTEFSRVLQQQSDYYSGAGAGADLANSAGNNPLAEARRELGEVRQSMVQNIDAVLDRGEKIELLVDKTDQLNQSAKVFQKSAKGLKNAMWWKNVKMWLMCVAYPAPPLPLSLSRARAWDTTQPLAR